MIQKVFEVLFPGGKKVQAEVEGQLIQSDQSQANGGEGSAPEPFILFLASIATCAGVYALNFCQTRHIDTNGLKMKMTTEFDEQKKLCTRIHLDLKLPDAFPEKYRSAILKAVDQCTVKRHLIHPPEFLLRCC